MFIGSELDSRSYNSVCLFAATSNIYNEYTIKELKSVMVARKPKMKPRGLC